LHSDSNQIHQDMIILQHEGSYHPPHKHPGKAETFSVLEGVLGIVCYDENGEVVDARRVEEGEIYRAAIHHYHLIMELTPIVIFHESKPGPFLGKEDTMIADWAPSLDDKFAVEQLMRKARDLLI
jgi:cupin fold WbuC family metalloprotein